MSYSTCMENYDTVIGIARNPYSMNVPALLIEAAAELDIHIRVIDVPTLTVEIDINKGAVVRDVTGVVDIEGYAKPSLKKYKPIAARNEDEKVFSGLL